MLAPGSRIGAYEVTGAIGAGGMGEVYRARDTRLQRDVALKSLPPAFATDADRVARFEREARALAALNHPNIAAIYGLERDADTSAIIMELVEGDDLSTRLARGPIPIDEALGIARQVAFALEAAHEAGIVHRDLKPGNIKIKADGTVKVLDFGLAKALGAPGSDELGLQGADDSPTIPARATHAGVILGTAAYMAPEQARGRAVDRRADVWAFGVVLYEMLTGRRAFSGDNVTDVMAAVIRDTPAIDTLPEGTPAAIRRLLRRCLEKDPRKRLRDMGDAGVELDEAIASPDQTGDTRASPADPAVRPSWALLGAIAILIGGAAGFGAWTLKPAPAPVRLVTRFTVALPEGQQLTTYTMPNLAVSPDGRRLAYRTPSGIFVRGLDELEPRLVARAPGAGLWFAPDGESLLVGTTSGLSVVSVAGGPMQEVVSSAATAGAHWTADGSIVYSTQTSIRRIPAGGGDAQEVVTAREGEFVAWPQVLPGGTRLLFTRLVGPRGLAVIRSLDDGSEQVVLKGVGGARYLNTGHFVYGLDGRVFAVPVKVSTGAPGGRPLLVPEIVHVSPQSGWVQAAISETGTLVYVSQGEAVSQSRLVLRDAKGPAVTVPTAPRVYSDVALSPDGRRAAVHLWDEHNDVWVADLVRGGLTRITFTPNEDETPVWSPDGLELAYVESRPGQPGVLFRRPADGGAAAVGRKVWEHHDHFHVNDWSPDGRTIVVEIRRQTSNDLLAIDVASGQETVLIASPYSEGQARLSRDGRWIAYSSDESGRQEVYVQPFPALDRRVAVSTSGGVEPIWSRDGRRLFFRSPTEFMEATVLSTSPLEFSAPRPLFADRYERTQGEMHTHFDVDAQGRFLVTESPQVDQAASQVAIHVVVNWAESLKMLAMGLQ